ncbi:putative enzyme related to lactoylglutathione lyase [Sphingobium sp. OAS761]|uniref:VOC family protein n=1 Tax=Sphingobium sp. OAS761 TaxID=2817901 RepID=UPI00209E614A|nr:VOC family protein [Sphingobium sp. OAS761]MCP1471463.1 putative enzyme related to lactoylglutathione lyase [Sphingobium sp. OAS761]
MPVTAFAYAKVVVSDSDALTPFYTQALGLTAAMRIEEGEGDHAFVENFFSAGAGAPPQIVLISYPNRPAPSVGESIVAVMVDDVDETLAAIGRAGGKTTVPAFDITEHKMRMAYAADPEGHSIELMKVG